MTSTPLSTNNLSLTPSLGFNPSVKHINIPSPARTPALSCPFKFSLLHWQQGNTAFTPLLTPLPDSCQMPQNLKIPSLLMPHPHLNSEPLLPLLIPFSLFPLNLLLFPPLLHFIQARSNSRWIMDGWIEDFHLSRFSFSLSFSCGMAVVLMQGNMHWRWAQGPPTQSVCLSAAWRISLSFCFSAGLPLSAPDWSLTFPFNPFYHCFPTSFPASFYS